MTDKKKQQTMRYTDDELGAIKSVFAENDDLLKAIRKSMLQMSLNALDLSMLEVVKTPAVLALLRKSLLPTLDGDAPLNQVIDLWMTVNIAEKDPFESYNQLKARELLINYIDQQLRVLSDRSAKEKIKFESLSNLTIPRAEAPQVFINFVARNTIIQHIEQVLNILKVLAGMKDETLEQTQERLRKDSSK